ncbi:uncharacterized protein F4812DRAFT_15695 [Daldinia caldariorum]|uniref:uncharacterized protein n=1 Tax=Daldinia caldariorum TaxID=326644 RepID=UPI0020072AC0|nr:uncharacterized protein F4812DRAFT_15695 [Daldinia caldariorum]KAI1472512.1 hypothetical protein F4812DRAFT_15695 [Daldinia caldariorum]
MSATNNGAAATSSAKRFELPALDFHFGSLTDGTDIPPPPPSPPSLKEELHKEIPKEEVPKEAVPKKETPKEEVPSPPKTPLPEEVERKETNGVVNGHGTSPSKPELNTVPANISVKRPGEDGPASPASHASSNRGSLRRLLSRNLLNNAYDEQGSLLSPTASSRPPSRTASTITEEKKSKRASGWFKKLRSHDTSSKRASQVFDHHQIHHQIEEPKKPAGPPPPMIPELSALKTKVDTHLGDDLFKEIK